MTNLKNRTLWTAATAALLLALGMTACSSGKASTQDQAVASAVDAKLKADPALAGANVSAAALNGVVTLSGTVASEQARLQAAQDAQVPGVTQVNNQIGTDTSATTSTPPAAAAAPAAGAAMMADSHAAARPRHEAASSAAGNAAPAAAAAPAPEMKAVQPVQVEAGTSLHVRLSSALSSATASAGDGFHGTLSQPVLVNGQIAIPQGAAVSGTIVTADSAGHFKGQSRLVLDVTQISYNGQSYEVHTTDIARVSANRSTRSKEAIGGGAAVGALIGALAGHGKGAAIGAIAGAGTGTAVQGLTKAPEVNLPAETVLTFSLKAPVQVVPSASN